jgi:hypothetical protein
VSSGARRATGERGASLIIALGFLALFGALIPVIVNLGTTNLVDTNKLNSQRSAVYAADGATDAALQYLKGHPGCGIPLQGNTLAGCPIFTGPSTAAFEAKLNRQIATTRIVATGNILDTDRSVDLTTSVDHVARVTVHAILRDSQVNSKIYGVGVTEAPIDVLSWKYLR